MCKECEDQESIKVETKVCKCCGEEKPVKEFARRNLNKSICRVCDFIKRNSDRINIDENNNIDMYKIILDNILNNKIKYVNELQDILDKNFKDIIKVLQQLKINGGRYKVIISSKCDFCNTPIELNVSSYMQSDIHFCNDKCVKKWLSVNNVGENNSRYNKKTLNCDWCGEEIKVHPFDIKRSKTHFCNKDCFNKWYKNVFSKTEEFLERNKQIALTNLKNGVFKTDSNIQIIVNDLLKSLDIEYINEYVLGKYSIDNWLINKDNIAIEVMGGFWHCDNRIYKEIQYELQLTNIYNDKSKNSYLKNKDIKVLYLWEDDILTNLQLCKILILEYIKNNGVLPNYHSFNYSFKNGILSLNKKIIKPYFKFSKKELFSKINIKEIKEKNNHVTFKCSNCGKEKTVIKSSYDETKEEHFCSRGCATEYRNKNNTVKTQCSYCGKEVKRSLSEFNKHKNHFCDKECHDKWQTKSIKMNCCNCNKVILVPPYKIKNNKHFFCSQECDKDYKSKNCIKKEEHWETLICENCGEKFQVTKGELNRRNRRFCSQECFKEYQKKEISDTK